METGKREEKEGDLSQDELHALSDKVQKLTDEHIAEIDSLLAAKEAEILQV
jgi:ribosome recycling factor